jgi:predicted transcriptional regulator
MRKLGDLERAVMDVVWDRAEAVTCRQVTEALAGRAPAYTTVMTVLDRLARKRFLEREQVGRAWHYWAAASRDSYVAGLMFDALDEAGDREAALVRFGRAMSEAEAATLRRALGRN